MAHKSAFLLIAIIMFASASQILGGRLTGTVTSLLGLPTQIVNAIFTPKLSISITGFNVTGTFCCMATGNCPSGAQPLPLPGALVSLDCTTLWGGSAILRQTTTNANGTFAISVPSLLGLLRPIYPLPCNTTVHFPLNQTICPILSTVHDAFNGVTAVLTSALAPVSLTVDGQLRAILNLRPTGFVSVGTVPNCHLASSSTAMFRES